MNQFSQMDITVRYWVDGETRTDYVCSYFLGSQTADDLLNTFSQIFDLFDKKKLLQVSMDGPNVNLSFLKKLIIKLNDDIVF